jgi:hypothetical protein
VNDRITGCAAAGSFLVSSLVSFLVVFAAADGTQANLLTPQPDLNLIAGLQIQQGGVSLADQQIAVALNLRKRQ